MAIFPSPIVPPTASAGLVRGTPPSTLATLAVGAIVIVALYFGRAVFVPLALAVLLSFALAPLVMRLRRWRFNRVLSVLAAVIIAFSIITGLGVLVGSQIAQLAGQLPEYQTNIVQKIQSLRGQTGVGGAVGRATAVLKNLGDEIAKPEGAANTKPQSRAAKAPDVHAPNPTQVEIRPPDATPLQIVESVIEPLFHPLAKAGIVVVFVIFVLLQREDLRDRFIRLVGPRDLHRTTTALDDAGGRISRYLLLQTAVNACFGVLLGIGLWSVGVPDPVLCGILAMLLRFVPFIGVVIAAAFPAALAIAVGPDWSLLFWAIGIFLVIELTVSQVVEPRLYGKNTGLSPIAIVIAAVFWAALWGPVGLLLSTPITVCLVVVGRHVENLRFLEILLGDQPPLAPEQSFYQRMLAEDPDDAARQAEDALKDMPLVAYYDQVAIKGLALAQLDVNRGALDHQQRIKIRTSIDGVIDNLSDHDDAPAAGIVKPPSTESPAPAGSVHEPAEPKWREGSVICVAGRGSLDESAAAILAHLLGKQGIVANVISRNTVSPANLAQFEIKNVYMACLSYLEPGSLSNARYLVRRLRRKLPGTKIMIGFWTLEIEDANRLAALQTTEADLVVVSLQQAVEQVMAFARVPAA
jgi:predicted PurR-regulated permease PerM